MALECFGAEESPQKVGAPGSFERVQKSTPLIARSNSKVEKAAMVRN